MSWEGGLKRWFDVVPSDLTTKDEGRAGPRRLMADLALVGWLLATSALYLRQFSSVGRGFLGRLFGGH